MNSLLSLIIAPQIHMLFKLNRKIGRHHENKIQTMVLPMMDSALVIQAVKHNHLMAVTVALEEAAKSSLIDKVSKSLDCICPCF